MKRRWDPRLVVLGLALLTVFSVLVPGVGDAALRAQTEEDKARIDREIESLQGQVNEASAEESRLLGLIDESSVRVAELDARVSALDSEISGVQSDLDAAQARLEVVEAEQRRAEVRLEDATARLEAARHALAQQAIAAYTGQSEAAQYARMLLGSASIDDLVTRRSYLKAVVGSQADLIAESERLRNEVGDLRDQLAQAQQQAVVERNSVAADRDRLRVARQAQDLVLQASASELAAQEDLRAEILARKDEFLAEMEVLERESAAIAETLRQRAAAREAGSLAALPAGDGTLLYPVPGAPITSPFGPRVHPIYGSVRMHTGIDIGAPTGRPILAAADGVVASAGGLGGYGNTTVVEHGGGLATLYGHQSSVLVAPGEQVTAGQTIGRVGCTGACTGPHLHFETRVDGEPVNPTAYL